MKLNSISTLLEQKSMLNTLQEHIRSTSETLQIKTEKWARYSTLQEFHSVEMYHTSQEKATQN